MTAYDDAISESDLYHGTDEDYEPPPDDATDSVTDEEIDARAEQTARERQG